MSRWIGCVVAVLASGCLHAAPPRAPAPPAAWSVAFERSIGLLASAPVFTADGGVVSSGYRFDRAGRYVGPLAMEVEGGRVITRIRAVLRDGHAVVENHQEGLLVGPADHPPEDATARWSGAPGALAVAPDERSLAVHRGDAVVVLALPSLVERERVALDGDTSGPIAVGFLRDGGLAYATPCRGAGCTGSGLEVRDRHGRRRRLRDGGITAVALAPDAAAIATARSVTIVGLPDGIARGTLALPGDLDHGITPAGALAIARGGTHVAAVTCQTLSVWAADRSRWRRVYTGTITRGQGEHGCAYASGLAFSPGGDRLALVARELTVLRPGPPPPPLDVTYQPRVPGTFEPAHDISSFFMPSPGTGLAAMPRVVGEWRGPGDVRVVARDASELSRIAGIEPWADALLLRYEPILRDPIHPDRFARGVRGIPPVLRYRRAFVDESGRRNVEYTMVMRGGCEESDRHVRWIEHGDVLVEIDIESLGVRPRLMRRWMTAWFDAPLSTSAPRDRRVAAYGFFKGAC